MQFLRGTTRFPRRAMALLSGTALLALVCGSALAQAASDGAKPPGLTDTQPPADASGATDAPRKRQTSSGCPTASASAAGKLGSISGLIWRNGDKHAAATYVEAHRVDGNILTCEGFAPVIDRRYTLSALPEGTYLVRVSRYSFTDAKYDVELYSERPEQRYSLVSLGAGEHRTNLNVTLTRLPVGELSGRVLDLGGRPAADVDVDLLKLTGEIQFIAKTNRRGEFTFPALAPNTYKLRFRPRSPGSETTHFGHHEFARSPAITVGDGAKLRLVTTLGTARGAIEDLAKRAEADTATAGASAGLGQR